ncbi:TPA: helix-turn-helix transcriptional regulator [Acinetobacter baumannii]|jgi:prophage regulatory protein|uniref:helix-turn-helix transcriptional regulator n=1 Tax=Acinetobacter baumannii TaxID=470 RepID=UPI00338ED7E0
MFQEEFLRIKDLANRPDSKGLIGVSSQTLWRWIQQNRFPAPIKIGSNISVFRMSEVQAWMKAQG